MYWIDFEMLQSEGWISQAMFMQTAKVVAIQALELVLDI
jgi:hypothetical protein